MIGMIEVAQIGDVPIRGFSMSLHQHESDLRVIHEPDELLADGGISLPYNPLGVRVTEVEINGTIYRSAGALAESTIARITNLIGVPVHIFAILPVQNNDGIWLQNYGIVQRVNRDPDEDGTSDIEVTIAMSAQWQALNRLLFEYTDIDQSGLNVYNTPETPGVDLLPYYPTYAEYIEDKESAHEYRWLFRSHHAPLMYNPDFWGLVINYMPPGFPSFGEFISWNAIPTIQHVYADPGLWNGRPLTTWALRKLETAYPVTITVWRSERFGGVDTITVDTAGLDTLLTTKTGTGLQSTDVLLLGDVSGRAIVIRDNAVAAHCTSVVSAYAGVAPGFIPSDSMAEYQVGFDYASATEWACLLQWRRLS